MCTIPVVAIVSRAPPNLPEYEERMGDQRRGSPLSDRP